jgi:glycosyltransferase involved in cell wall biosynthesis
MPCHNAEKYVGEAIESVLNQTYKNIELIVVNDSSSDRSGEVLEKYRGRGVKVITERCGSASKARNRAFRQARGKYIKFFDADDLISSEMIERQVKSLNGKQDSVAMSEWGRFYNDDIRSFKINPQSCWKTTKGIDWLIEALMDAQPMMQAGMFLIPSELAKKTGPWVEIKSPNDDFEYFCRLLSDARQVKFVPGTTLYYRSGIAKSLSQKNDRTSQKYFSEFIVRGVFHILAKNKSPKSKAACANMCQHVVYSLYPFYPEARKALQNIVESCGGSTIEPMGGRYFNLLRPFIGWKMARILQKAVGK